jgi:hypothetical protein
MESPSVSLSSANVVTVGLNILLCGKKSPHASIIPPLVKGKIRLKSNKTKGANGTTCCTVRKKSQFNSTQLG